jgi:hypothetical protein
MRQPIAAVARTLDSVFAYRRTFVVDPESALSDFVFFVSDHPLLLDDAPAFRDAVTWLEEHELDLSGAAGQLITDDVNPLATLNIKKAEHYQALLRERVGQDLLFPYR